MISYQKANAKRGNKIQDIIEDHNNWLHATGRCFVFRVPEEMKITGFEGAAKTGFVKGHTYLDYAGVLNAPAGQFVGLEVKSVSESKTKDNCAISRNFPFSTLNPKQQLSAKKTAAAGGWVCVFVRRIQRNGHQTDYLFPVTPAGHIAGVDNRKSLPWADAESFKIKPGELWLDALERLAAAGYYNKSKRVEVTQ